MCSLHPSTYTNCAQHICRNTMINRYLLTKLWHFKQNTASDFWIISNETATLTWRQRGHWCWGQSTPSAYSCLFHSFCTSGDPTQHCLSRVLILWSLWVVLLAGQFCIPIACIAYTSKKNMHKMMSTNAKKKLLSKNWWKERNRKNIAVSRMTAIYLTYTRSWDILKWLSPMWCSCSCSKICRINFLHVKSNKRQHHLKRKIYTLSLSLLYFSTAVHSSEYTWR